MTVLGIYSWTRLWSMGERRGAESFSLSFNAFVKRGHALHVVAPREPGQPRVESQGGVTLHRFGPAWNLLPDPFRRPLPLRIAERVAKYAAFQILASWTALRVGRRVGPDAVVAFGAFGVPASRWVARRLGVVNVTRLFGQSLNLCVGRRLKYYGNFPEIFAMKSPSAYVVLHDDGAEGDEMARLLGVPEERFRYWKNGIDPDLHRPDMDTDAVRRELGFGKEHILLFCVTRMAYEKHLDRVLDALPSVLEREPRVRLFLVGDGAERERLEEKVRTMGLAGHVRFTGAKPREELYRYFNTGDVFLSVSDRTNGGNPTVEAMYCERPVLVLGTGGTARLVEDRKTGIVLAPADLRELPARILELASDDGLRRRLGRAAREAVSSQVPTIEERQRMEAEIVEQAVAESRCRARFKAGAPA